MQTSAVGTFQQHQVTGLQTWGQGGLNVIKLFNWNSEARRRAECWGKRHHAEPVVPAQTPKGEVVYWIGPPGEAKDAGPGTDFHAVKQGKISVSPLKADLTHFAQSEHLTAWL